MTGARRPLEVVVRDRTDQVPPNVRAYASSRLRRLSSHLVLLEKAEIEFDREAKRSREPLEVVEITVKMTAHRLLPLRVRETGRDLRETLDLALKRIDEEILTLKGRFR
ncbi:MAG TPA: HPF/RaiA family ribosome-associated protein [Candidatus Limnocylindrales bacterium]|nr:HPF/RaiA family ribosome-associated protein [Candidatus Limnocylindrales bacterium]